MTRILVLLLTALAVVYPAAPLHAPGQEAGTTISDEAGDRLPSLASSATLDLRDFALATPRVSFVVRSGIASTYGPAYSEWWVALPDGPGWRFRVCGPGGCRTLVSTDSGPSKAMQRAGRIVDLPRFAFEAVSGVSWRMGLAQVTVTIIGRVR